jgi:kynurenine formamidase
MGTDTPAACWLTTLGGVAIGADTRALEVVPNPDRTKALPVHQRCLARAGVHIIETLALEELVVALVHSFCLVVLPPKFRGANDAPVRPGATI